MGVAVMILLSLPIGWFVRDRLIAFVAYVAVFSLLFAFQSTMLIIDWAGGSKKAFGSFPKTDSGEVWSYGLVNLVFLAVGAGPADRGQRAVGASTGQACGAGGSARCRLTAPTGDGCGPAGPWSHFSQTP